MLFSSTEHMDSTAIPTQGPAAAYSSKQTSSEAYRRQCRRRLNRTSHGALLPSTNTWGPRRIKMSLCTPPACKLVSIHTCLVPLHNRPQAPTCPILNTKGMDPLMSSAWSDECDQTHFAAIRIQRLVRIRRPSGSKCPPSSVFGRKCKSSSSPLLP